jgi:hypothetical protein
VFLVTSSEVNGIFWILKRLEKNPTVEMMKSEVLSMMEIAGAAKTTPEIGIDSLKTGCSIIILKAIDPPIDSLGLTKYFKPPQIQRNL